MLCDKLAILLGQRMATDNKAKEWLQRAYVRAVAALANVGISVPEDDHGVDGTFHAYANRDGRLVQSTPHLDYQCKATARVSPVDGVVRYPLEAKTYNDLADRRKAVGEPGAASSPIVLLLMILPADRTNWLSCTPEQLIIRHCCYWYSVSSSEPTANTGTKTIEIPSTQRFTPPALRNLLEMTKTGKL